MVHPERRANNPFNRMFSRRYPRIRSTRPAYGHAGFSVPLNSRTSMTRRKADLVALGNWAVDTGRGWLVRAVHAAIECEGLRHA
jgi:hypothetical protein